MCVLLNIYTLGYHNVLTDKLHGYVWHISLYFYNHIAYPIYILSLKGLLFKIIVGFFGMDFRTRVMQR